MNAAAAGEHGEFAFELQSGGSRLLRGTGSGDTLSSSPDQATLLFGEGGNDRLEGSRNVDKLTGGAGNDTLEGGLGSDTYVFAAGSGNDSISEYYSAPGDIDVAWFDGIASTAVTALERKGLDLVLRYGSTDQLTVSGYFNRADFRIEQFRFSDGVVWDDMAIMAKVMTNGDANANTLYGYDDGSNRMYGLDGGDYLSGGSRDDLLDGGNGNDRLVGASGADALIGGAGNDTLEGGRGSDTYVFKSGSGNDSISEYYSDTGDIDVARFDGIASTAVTALERKGLDLVLRYGSTDQLTVSGYFDRPGFRIEQFRFSEGVVWDDVAIKAKVLTNGDANANALYGYDDGSNRMYGLDGDDDLSGGSWDDLLDGGNGNDRLVGASGADTLIGGAGNDKLEGGRGSDTYVFKCGSGNDSISESYSDTGDTDVLTFGTGIATDQLWFRKSGTDLEVSLIGTSDKVVIGNWYSSASSQVERFKTADGRLLLASQVDALVSAMAGFAPPAAGQTTLPPSYQSSLSPALAANWH